MKINAITNLENTIFKKTDKKSHEGKKPFRNISLPELNIKILLPEYQKRYLRLVEGMQADGQEMAQLVEECARKYVIYKDKTTKTALITKEHCYLAYLKTILDYAEKAKNGEIDYQKNPTHTSSYVSTMAIEWVWARENAYKTAQIIKEEYDRVEQDLKEKSSQNAFVSSLMIDEDFMKDIDDIASVAMADLGTYDIKNISGNSVFYMSAIMGSTSSTTQDLVQKVLKFFHKLSLAATTEDIDENAVAMPYYQEIASRVIKNADRNYNMFITYSKNDESSPEYFVNNLIGQLKNIDDGEYKNFKKDKIKVIVFDKHAGMSVIADECNNCKDDPDTQYFFVIKDFYTTFYSSVTMGENGRPTIAYTKIEDSISTKAKNVHFILVGNQDNYYNLMEQPIIEKAIRDYQNIQIPIMDENALKEQVLYTKDYIKSQIDNDIDEEALAYISTLPLNSRGSGYDNVVRFIKNIASYYVSGEKITKDMAKSYWENTQKSDLLTQESPYDIVFNTNKTLDSIAGTPMVKKQAQNVVYELKNFPKTKGYIIYNTQGSSGGRMNCAKAIAGELKIPMICINAADFAMRDLDTANQDPMKAIEVKMTKLVNMLKTQAQANQNKMVMLFISNFDNFGSDPIYGLSSIYEQQAFQKLLREMKKSSLDNSYNIVVMGASDYPEATKEDILRPNLFMDKIVIYPPSTPQNFEEIAKNHIKKNDYKIENEDSTLAHFVKLMNGVDADYVDTVHILDRANILAHKRGSDVITIADINEAYLSIESGEVSECNISERQKDVIIRHEGGHALNLQFMYNLLKEQGDDLRIGDSIINIALDPRGDYLGCVYSAKSYENTTEYNMETVMSDLVCSFGGNSSEELFFKMSGSMGISQDMHQINSLAKFAVLVMGLGARTKHFMPDIDPETGTPCFSSMDDQEDYSKDVKTLLENAKIISDKIVECYADFLKEFSRNNISKFATGECIITGEDFAKSLKDWENKQPEKKKREIAKLKKEVLVIIECTKKGKIYSPLTKFNPIYRMF